MLTHVVDSAAKKKNGGNEPQVDGMQPERALFICYICNYTSSTKPRFIQHISVGNCNLKAGSANSLPAYTRQNASNDYVCTQCDRAFRTKLNLDEHIIKRHIESVGSISSKVHECSHCDYKTMRTTNLRRHTLTHHTAPKFSICKRCNATFSSEKSLDNHVIKTHPGLIASLGKGIYECPNCTYKTTTLVYFNSHLKIHSSGKLKKCEHCDATFRRKLSLDDHVVRKHPNVNASLSNRIHQCPSCDFKTARKCDIDKHILKHSDSSDTCKHCDRKHNTEHVLSNHITKTHSITSKIHECSLCPFKTANELCFVSHMTCHSEMNVCKHCTAPFTRKCYLDDHIVKKHPDFIASVERKIYECTDCTYKTVRKDMIERHAVIHRSNC
nr:unnamed protein product [Callosobruchus analis]